MITPAVNTIIKVIEQFPEAEQHRVADHSCEYLADLEDEQIRMKHLLNYRIR
jgi:hypothetical protein